MEKWEEEEEEEEEEKEEQEQKKKKKKKKKKKNVSFEHFPKRMRNKTFLRHLTSDGAKERHFKTIRFL